MAALYAERMKAMKKIITSRQDRIHITSFIGCAGNEMMSLCWRRRGRAKSGGVVPLMFVISAQVSLAAVHFKEQSRSLLPEQAVISSFIFPLIAKTRYFLLR
jgi:hypothetical protein